MEGEIATTNGQDVTFTNLDICDICESNNDFQDYLMIHPWNGGWSWSNLFAQRRFVIEVPCTNLLVTPPSSQNTLAQTNNSTVTNVSREMKLEKLMPNPAIDYIYVEIENFTDQTVEMKIFDTMGRLVKTQNSSLTIGMNQVYVDINELETGVYFIQIPNMEASASKMRFVKVRM